MTSLRCIKFGASENGWFHNNKPCFPHVRLFSIEPPLINATTTSSTTWTKLAYKSKNPSLSTLVTTFHSLVKDKWQSILCNTLTKVVQGKFKMVSQQHSTLVVFSLRSPSQHEFHYIKKFVTNWFSPGLCNLRLIS